MEHAHATAGGDPARDPSPGGSGVEADCHTSGAVTSGRAVGVIMASAAGDALGAGYEFGPAMSADQPVGMVGGGVFNWAPGEWTDDTQMSLCMLEVLAKGVADVAQVEAAFRTWYRSGPPDVGNSTRAVLARSEPLREAALAQFADHPNGAGGNGSLMRTGPVALSRPGDPEGVAGLAVQMSELTHADPDCLDACVLWSVAIDHTIHTAPAGSQAWDWTAPLHAALVWLPEERRSRWAELIEAAARSVPTDFDKNGWVVHAFQAALSAICSTPVPEGSIPAGHLQLALETAVRAGGDTDTVAAIAGSMLGARWGVDAVPERWRRQLKGRGATTAPLLTADDLERLARAAYGHGTAL